MRQGRQSFLAFADDLMGALDVGAKFAAQGIRARVTTGWDPAPVCVVDIETRHMIGAEAARRVDRLVRSAADAELLYAKTDSTLRGNIGSQLGAMFEAAPGPLLYVPAYPAQGRTVVDGRLLVFGTLLEHTAFARDALNPATESRIVEVIRRQTSAPLWVVDARALRADVPAGIYPGFPFWVPVVWQYTPSRPFLILRDTVFPSGAVFRPRIVEVSPCRKIQNREAPFF